MIWRALSLKQKINDGGERINYGEQMAIREPAVGKGAYYLVSPFPYDRLAKWYEMGAAKYTNKETGVSGARNWEKGMPFSRFADSAERHFNKWKMGLEDEDHLIAAIWNLWAIAHFEELGRTDLDDMPHYLRESADGQKG